MNDETLCFSIHPTHNIVNRVPFFYWLECKLHFDVRNVITRNRSFLGEQFHYGVHNRKLPTGRFSSDAKQIDRDRLHFSLVFLPQHDMFPDLQVHSLPHLHSLQHFSLVHLQSKAYANKSESKINLLMFSFHT